MKKQSCYFSYLLLFFIAVVPVGAVAATEQPQLDTEGKLVFQSADGEHQFRIGGRLQWDITLVSEDADYVGNSDSQIRRARLYLSGTTARFWDFKFQFDFEDADDNDQAIEDAYIRYTGMPVKITLGQRKTPYGMGELTSSKYTTFIERSMVSSLFASERIGVGGRAPGVTLHYTWHDFLLEGGYYLLRTPAGGSREIDDGNGMTGRAVWAQYDKKKKRLLHVGVASGFRHYANDTVGRVRIRPNVSTGDYIFDTGGNINAEDYMGFNLQLAALYDRLWANAEYHVGAFDLADGSVGDDDMMGFYLQAGLFLTDDSRRYKNGVWGSVTPRSIAGKGGIGAWEIAVRYDAVEVGAGLIDGSQSNQRADTVSVALNWYPINNIRFQANYIMASCDRCAFTAGDPAFFALRSQIFF